MFGMFNKKLKQAASNVKKFENKDLAEGLVGACLLVAYADGDCGQDEIENMTKQLDAHPALQGFGSEIGKLVDSFKQRLDAGFLIGKTQIMREIGDCTHDANEAEDIFVAAITIAQADGDIDPEEVIVLKEIGKKLNLQLSAYGIDG